MVIQCQAQILHDQYVLAVRYSQIYCFGNSVKLLILDNLLPCVIHVNYVIIELHQVKT